MVSYENHMGKMKSHPLRVALYLPQRPIPNENMCVFKNWLAFKALISNNYDWRFIYYKPSELSCFPNSNQITEYKNIANWPI